VHKKPAFAGATAGNLRDLGWLANRSAAGAKIGGAERDRTADLLIANEALSQLSYGPDRGRRNGAPQRVGAIYGAPSQAVNNIELGF
jgi:hypothetical protein